MPLVITYSKQLEKKRIKNTFKKLSWYDELGYRPRFPKDVNPRADDLKDVYSALDSEYEEKDYQEFANKTSNEFSKIEHSFFEKLQKICGKRIRRNFNLILTKYGVGGSYFPPNKIIYNIAMKNTPINSILHEIVHLTIEKYIQKYNIQQNEKERIVDLILSSNPIALPNYQMQERGEVHRDIIDPLFKEYFNPPIDIFFKKFMELKKKKELC